MTVTTDTRGSVLVVTIDRPDVRNAIDRPTADALVAAFQGFATDESVKVAVLTGAGTDFCAGADLKAITEEPERTVRVAPDGAGPLGPTWMALDKPTIAAIEGHAVAGGLELALWCDLRVAGEGATFGVFCRRWGVPLMDGGTVRLPRIVGMGRALDMILTGRPVDAAEAHSIGLVNRVVSAGTALERAIVLGDEIARYPQTCLRSDRRSLYAALSLDLERARLIEYSEGMATLGSGETTAGAARFASGHGRHGSFEDI